MIKFPETFTGKEKNLYAVIETPRGSRNKYNYNTKNGFYELDKILPAGTCFPLDFGFIPHTLAEDGDPLDIMVMMDLPAFTGCLMECRAIGIIEAIQKEKSGKKERNDRILGVCIASQDYSKLKDIHQLSKNYLEELTHFFEYYNQMCGKKFKIVDIKGPEVALASVQSHISKK